MSLKKILLSAILCMAVMAGYSFAQGEAEGDDLEYQNPSWINNVPPTSFWGLRGLPNTVSAEPLGMGRFNMAAFGSYFKQEQSLLVSPKEGTHVITGRGALSWGINNNVDLFGVLPFYVLYDDDRGGWGNIGELMGGVQFSLPLPEDMGIRLAGQIHFIYGIRTGEFDENEVTSNVHYAKDGTDEPHLSYAGYDYFEARKRDQLDLVLKLSQSSVHGNLRRAIKFHLNEGVAGTPGISNDWLFIYAAGVQGDVAEFLTVGVEINGRTILSKPNLSKDPLWLTFSTMYRSPYYGNGLVGWGILGGVDYRVSQGKEVAIKGGNREMYPLEQMRIFGDFVLSFDFMASKRAEMDRLARENAAEKARLRKQAALTAAQKDSVARKAHEDSLRLAAEMAQRAQADSIRAKAVADSLAALMDDQMLKARQDSLALTQSAAQREAHLRAEAERKRVADSIALAETQRKLEEEKTKRSEAEQMMLSTGMLVLDGVYFTTGKAEIQLNSRGYLTTIARMLVKYPKLRLEIGGHTDNAGRFETNMALSQKRAEAVFLFLHNVDPALAPMLSAKGYGPTMPKADNATAAGREINRRVEIKVLNPEVLKEYNK